MKHKIEAIQNAAADLELARAAHERAILDLATVRNLCGQNGYAVTVNGISIPVAENGGRDSGWAAKMIRGREMIHLGALKALQGVIDARADKVKVFEVRLKRLAEELTHVCP
ncbi:hypothetical protein D3C85_60280 [compost metagenome]